MFVEDAKKKKLVPFEKGEKKESAKTEKKEKESAKVQKKETKKK